MSSEKVEINPSIEHDRHVPHAYIFDVDGPLSDPKERRVTEPKVVEELASMLERGDVVALNTGRSIEWLLKGPKQLDGTYPEGQKGLIDLLDERVEVKALFRNFYAIGEKGGSELRYENGKWEEKIDETITIPHNLQEEITRITREYSEWMFVDDTKRTMSTSEMNALPDGLSEEEKKAALAVYHEKQHELEQRLRTLLEEGGIAGQFKVDPTAIATDVEATSVPSNPEWNRGVGKDYGALHILKWMIEELHLDPTQLHVDTIGDSGSDVPMANELNGKVKTVRFVFVGDSNKESNQKGLAESTVPVHITSSKDSAGTIEFLEEQKQNPEIAYSN